MSFAPHWADGAYRLGRKEVRRGVIVIVRFLGTTWKISTLKETGMNRKGFTLIELMIVIAIIAIIAAIAIPGLLAAQRSANERNSSASLKTMATSEIDYRSNDRDGNRINDFYTYDVQGLFLIQTATDAASALAAPTVKMINASIAGADSVGATAVGVQDPLGGNSTWHYRCTAASFLPTRGPKAGYWYYAMDSDASELVLEAYKNQTDGGVGVGNSCHSVSKFGFGAYPDSTGSGRSMFMINESATVIRFPLNRTVRPTPAAFPPGLPLINTGTGHPSTFMNWPNNTDFKLASKLD